MQLLFFLLYGCLSSFLTDAKPWLNPSVSSTLPSAPPLSRHPMARQSFNPNQPEYYGPSQTALLFLDYLNVLVNMIPDEDVRQNLIDSAKQLLATARKYKVPIIHCTVDIDLDPAPTTKIYEDWFLINKPAFEAQPELVEEHPDLAPTRNSTGGYETVSLRVAGTRSAFINKDLLPLIRETLGVTSLIIGGIATSGAVIGTALQGIDESFVVTVVRDAVWDPNQQVHEDILDFILPSSAYVVSTMEAVSYLRGY